MQCGDVQELIETFAEGDAPSGEASQHLEACSRCAASLARARQIHQALQAVPVPSPRPEFTPAVIALTHSLRWRSEQRFDWWFNAIMAASAAIIALGIWGLMHVTGLNAVAVGTADFITRSVPDLYQRFRPELSLYGTATALLAGGLLVWWWLERGGRPRFV